ncbi:hypothetical protein ACU4GD_39240 [Cupriavidus basilensis]
MVNIVKLQATIWKLAWHWRWKSAAGRPKTTALNLHDGRGRSCAMVRSSRWRQQQAGSGLRRNLARCMTRGARGHDVRAAPHCLRYAGVDDGCTPPCSDAMCAPAWKPRGHGGMQKIRIRWWRGGPGWAGRQRHRHRQRRPVGRASL